MLDRTDAPAPAGGGLFDLDTDMCRWPLWAFHERAVDGGRYCGAGVVEGAYCRHHATLAYAPPDMRRAKPLSPFVLPGVMPRPAPRQLDDLGSVQDGCKMSSDGQSGREGAQAAPPALPSGSGGGVTLADPQAQMLREAMARARREGRNRRHAALPDPAPRMIDTALPSREEAAMPATLPEPDAVDTALAGIASGPSNEEALHMLRLLLRDALPGRALYLYGPAGCGKSLMLAAARAALPVGHLRLLDDAHDATEARCRQITGGGVRGFAVGRLAPSDCRAREALAGAVVVAIAPPDPALCRAALEAEARRLVRVLDEPALAAFLALDLPLPAMLATLRTLVLGGGPVTAEAIAAHAAQLMPAKVPSPVRIDDVQRVVCRHYGVTREDLLSQRRTAAVVKPRQIAMYLAKVLTLRSLPEIGRRFGGRDHTTVLHAVLKLTRQVEIDAALAAEVAGLTAAIREAR
ncbi:helix-turn-helix domain-containing protein [Ancylobacter sp.]|uniref:helix-turn-helix domain-containing protein n=1 Tax=Ancylobacter sp. TaxID=1872567 RepID=UPI003C7B61EA